MTRFARIFTLVVLPLLTLGLGWQLGIQYEQKQYSDLRMHWEDAYTGGTDGSVIADPESEVDISLLWTVWRLLGKHYISPSDLEVTPLLYGAVEGLTRAVKDPYTVFMTPKESNDFHQSLAGKLEGIGAELTLRDGLVVVVAPLKGSPASAAGIQPGDTILEVDGEDIRGENLQQVVSRIRGKKGTEVILKVLHKGEPETDDITITRDEITVPSVTYEIKETASGSIGLLELNQFGDGSIRELERGLRTFEGKDLKGIVLDLRYNGGGYLEGAVDLASLFLRQGKVVTVRRRGIADEDRYVSGRPIEPDLPLAVLINEGSASASEIVAGALSDHERGKLIGMQSFGKGTVQEVIELPGGSSLRVTVAKWLTPGGHDLGHEGLTPDIEVDRTREQYEANEDPQMDAALEWLLDNEGLEEDSR